MIESTRWSWMSCDGRAQSQVLWGQRMDEGWGQGWGQGLRQGRGSG